MPSLIAFSFRPGNAQFVLYDIHAVANDFEDSLWGRDGESGPLSVRTTELAIGLFDDYKVEIRVSTFERAPAKLDGNWEIEAEASLLVQSGELGIRDVTSSTPEQICSVTEGWSTVRVFGVWLGEQAMGQAAQLFHIQIWPET